MTRRRLFLLVLLLLTPCRGHGQDLLSLGRGDAGGAVDIGADSIRLEEDGDLVEAEGNVVLRWSGARLTARRANYSAATGIAVAEEDVVLEDQDGNVIRCNYLKIDLNDLTGTVHDGRLWVPGDGYHLWGRRFRKTGRTTYEIRDGGFTSCDGTWPSWRVEADQVDVELGGYLVARGATFWFEGAPVLYTPYLVFPVKTERQSGFLMPRLGFTDRNGFFVGTQFYWAFADSADLTLGVEYRSRRGFTESAELRYVLAENHGGSAEVTHLRDSEENRNRYTVKANHRSRFEDGSQVRMVVDATSDDTYLEDLGDTLDERGTELLESYLLGTRPVALGTAFGLLNYYQALDADQSETLQTLPSIGLEGWETPLVGPFYWDPSVNYTRFWRDEGTDGDRVIVNPLLAMDLQTRGIGLALRAGYRQNMYQVDDETLIRGALRGQVTAESSFYRAYGSLIHTLEPSVSLIAESNGAGDEVPVFDPADEFSTKLDLGLVLESRFLRSDDLTPFAGVDLETTYELDDGEWAPFRGEVSWYPSERLTLRAEGLYDRNVRDPWLQWSLWGDARNRRGDRLFAGYRYLKQEASYADAGFRLGATRWLALLYRHRYSVRDSETLEETYGLQLAHPCWESLVSVSRNLREDEDGYEWRFFLTLELRGLATLGSDPGILP